MKRLKHQSFPQAPGVKTKITFDTFKSPKFTRSTTFITWRTDALTLVNKSEEMFMCVKLISLPNLIYGYSPLLYIELEACWIN